LELPEEIRIQIGFDVEQLPSWITNAVQNSTTAQLGTSNQPTKNTEALGGPVYPGLAYWVGERGPEPLIPFTAGRIVPNNKVSGGVVIEAGAIQINGVSKNTDIPFLVDTLMDEIQRRLI